MCTVLIRSKKVDLAIVIIRVVLSNWLDTKVFTLSGLYCERRDFCLADCNNAKIDRFWPYWPNDNTNSDHNKRLYAFITFRVDHGDDLEADVLLHPEVQLSKACDDLRDLLHHRAHVLVQLVHRDRLPHHLRQAGL